MKILLAVDGSTFTKKMLAYVAAHDEWLGDRHQYTVVHVVPKIPPHAASFLAREAVDAYYADESEKVFKPIRTFFGKHGLQAEFVGLSGHAGETISGLADRGSFDLLMMGSHGHGQLGNLVMGSVATRIVAGCRVPVLLVR
jgi:nucleotide-binding universal stress UspA family protein